MDYEFLKNRGIFIEQVESHLVELTFLSEFLEMKIQENSFERA